MQVERNSQRDLARNLIEAMGIEHAAEIARRNHWDGVLAEFLVLVPSLARRDAQRDARAELRFPRA